MKHKGMALIAAGAVSLAAAVFLLPTPLFEVLAGKTGLVSLPFVAGLVALVAALALLAVGFRRRGRDLRTARTYDSREPSSLDGDRPSNPYALPKSYGALPPELTALAPPWCVKAAPRSSAGRGHLVRPKKRLADGHGGSMCLITRPSRKPRVMRRVTGLALRATGLTATRSLPFVR